MPSIDMSHFTKILHTSIRSCATRAGKTPSPNWRRCMTRTSANGFNFVDNKMPTFDKVLFYGRTSSEYLDMFGIKFDELKGLKILDCPGGPSSFTADANKAGIHASAIDPVYALPEQKLREIATEDILVTGKRILAALPLSSSRVKAFTADKMAALDVFLEDFLATKGSKRYLPEALPKLSFADNSFDVTLSANFLFTYAPPEAGGLGAGELGVSAFDLDWHKEAVTELLRVTKSKVYIFPAHTYSGDACSKHPYAQAIMDTVSRDGSAVQVSWFQSSYRQGTDGDVVGLLLDKTISK